MVWSHLKKKRMKYLSHEVNGLLPGVRYQFQVPKHVSCRFSICDGGAGAVKSWDNHLLRLDKSYISYRVSEGLQAIFFGTSDDVTARTV